MKILLVHVVDRREQYGGVEKMVVSLALGLRDYGGIEAAVMVNESRLAAELRRHGFSVYESPPKGIWNVPAYVRRILQVGKTFTPSLVHSHHRFSTLLFQCVPARHYKLVHTFHVEQFSKKWLRFFGDAATAVSQGCKDYFVRTFRIPEDFITVIHNGVAKEANPCDGQELLQQRLATTIAVIARLTEQKGHTFLLQALALLIREPLDGLRVYLVGDGEKRYELERQAERLGLSKVVAFVGHQENVYPYIAASDFTVLPSLWEGFGLSAVESMLCGKPVIGSRVGGLPEIIRDGISGLLVPPGDVGKLADAMRSYIQNPDRVLRAGRTGQEEVRSQFSVSAMIEKYYALYRRFLLPNEN